MWNEKWYNICTWTVSNFGKQWGVNSSIMAIYIFLYVSPDWHRDLCNKCRFSHAHFMWNGKSNGFQIERTYAGVECNAIAKNHFKFQLNKIYYWEVITNKIGVYWRKLVVLKCFCDNASLCLSIFWLIEMYYFMAESEEVCVASESLPLKCVVLIHSG